MNAKTLIAAAALVGLPVLAGAADKDFVAKTWLKLRMDELKQFEELTSATFAGSAKVMSTH